MLPEIEFRLNFIIRPRFTAIFEIYNGKHIKTSMNILSLLNIIYNNLSFMEIFIKSTKLFRISYICRIITDFG